MSKSRKSQKRRRKNWQIVRVARFKVTDLLVQSSLRQPAKSVGKYLAPFVLKLLITFFV